MPIPEEILTRIRENDPTLTFVDIGHNLSRRVEPFTQREIAKLANALRNNNVVTRLNLNGTGLNTPLKFGAIAQALFEHESLQELDLRFNRFDERCVNLLSTLLQKNKTLTILKLERAVRGDKCATALAPGLRENTSLLTLELNENLICDEGIRAIANAIKENPNIKLTDLNLVGNYTSAEGARALAEMLEHNQTLTMLALSNNCIHDHQGSVFARALQKNTTLQRLFYDRHKCNDRDTITIDRLLKRNEIPESDSESYDIEESNTQKNTSAALNDETASNTFHHPLHSATSLIETEKTTPALTPGKVCLVLTAIKNSFSTKQNKLSELGDLINEIDTIEVLRCGFDKLLEDEENHRQLREEQRFFTRSGRTNSWQEAVGLFKDKAIELATEVKAEGKTLPEAMDNSNPFYRILNYRRSRYSFKRQHQPTRLKEYKRIVEGKAQQESSNVQLS